MQRSEKIVSNWPTFNFGEKTCIYIYIYIYIEKTKGEGFFLEILKSRWRASLEILAASQ
jgi:hypothetical protein